MNWLHHHKFEWLTPRRYFAFTVLWFLVCVAALAWNWHYWGDGWELIVPVLWLINLWLASRNLSHAVHLIRIERHLDRAAKAEVDRVEAWLKDLRDPPQ